MNLKTKVSTDLTVITNANQAGTMRAGFLIFSYNSPQKAVVLGIVTYIIGCFV
ncbi:hypothetical protein ABGV42_02580 [Paenibacillus pabuli]